VALTKVTGNGLGAFTQDGGAVFNESSADTDFRIESNGNANMFVVDAGTDKIGIGTAAPTVTLEVANASNPALSGVTNRNPIIQLTNTDTGYVAGNATAIDFATSLNYTNASIICRNDNSGSGYGGSLIFATATTGNSLAERMRVDNSGAVLIGKTSLTSNDAGLELNTGAAANVARVDHHKTASGDFAGYYFFHNGSNVGGIDYSNSAVNYATSSDHRLKENVADMTGAITRVKALTPKRFNFIIDPDTTVDGFLAHEAQTVVPEAVRGTHNEVETWTQQQIDDGDAPDGTSAGDNKLDGDGNTIPVMQGIDQSKLVPLLTGALQEAIAKIETLETQRADIETRLAALEGE